MSSTHFRTLAAILLVSAIVIGGHLLPGFDNSPVEDEVRNGLHVLVFAAFAVIVFEIIRSAGMAVVITAAVTIVIVATIGGLAEFLQYLKGRQPDIFDVVRDISGAVLALSGRMIWLWSGGDRRSWIMKQVARLGSVLISLSVFAPLMFWLSIIGMGRMSSPVILDFDQWWNKYIYRPINAEIIAPAGVAGTAEIQLFNWRRSGLVISPMMTDWSDYEYLTITAGMLKGPDTNVTVRINDSANRNNWSDHFLASIIVVSKISKVRIPLREIIVTPGHRSMDLSDIQEIVIFARDGRKDTVMLIDDIRLE